MPVIKASGGSRNKLSSVKPSGKREESFFELVFEVTRQISPNAYRLRLPKKWKIHQVRNITELEPFLDDGKHELNPEKVLREAPDVEPDYKVEKVMAAVHARGKILYIVKWRNYPLKKDWTREPWENFTSEGAKETVMKFHRLNPNAPTDPEVARLLES